VRDDAQRLVDIVAAADAIAAHLQRGSVSDGLIFDAVRVRLIEIGEAVKAIDPAVLASEPDVPWQDVAGMRNHLAHRYFDTDRSPSRGSAASSSTEAKHELQPAQNLYYYSSIVTSCPEGSRHQSSPSPSMPTSMTGCLTRQQRRVSASRPG